MADFQIQNKLKETLKPLHNIRMAFLFGSAAAGKIRVDSDIDVAVQFENIPDAFATKEIQEEIADAVGRPTDLIVLNSASPILRMQILKNGILLFSKDPNGYSNFLGHTVSQYEDLKIIRRAIEEKILKGRIYG